LARLPTIASADRPAIEFGWRAAGEFANKEHGICNPREDAANHDLKQRDECVYPESIIVSNARSDRPETRGLSRFSVALLLSPPDVDFTDGAIVFTEQGPRMRSRAEVVPLQQGNGVIFPVHHRPVHARRGSYQVRMRCGAGRVHSGSRHTVATIFHDAK
jgi:Oxygenase, catalysing oxidative methylation of damaged DNA